jgi:hypothetical protein
LIEQAVLKEEIFEDMFEEEVFEKEVFKQVFEKEVFKQVFEEVSETLSAHRRGVVFQLAYLFLLMSRFLLFLLFKPLLLLPF